MFSVAHNHLQYRQYLYFSHTISENRQVISLGDITYSYPHAFDTHVKAASYGPVSVCLSVCLSQVGVLSKRMDGLSWFLAWRLVIYPTLCCKEIQLSTKLRVLPSGTLSQTPD